MFFAGDEMTRRGLENDSSRRRLLESFTAPCPSVYARVTGFAEASIANSVRRQGGQCRAATLSARAAGNFEVWLVWTREKLRRLTLRSATGWVAARPSLTTNHFTVPCPSACARVHGLCGARQSRNRRWPFFPARVLVRRA